MLDRVESHVAVISHFTQCEVLHEEDSTFIKMHAGDAYTYSEDGVKRGLYIEPLLKYAMEKKLPDVDLLWYQYKRRMHAAHVGGVYHEGELLAYYPHFALYDIYIFKKMYKKIIL